MLAETGDSTEQESRIAGTEGDPDTLPEASAFGAAGDSVALLAEAVRVLETMSASSYSHRTHISNGEYDVDCSGFVDWLLGRVNKAALAELQSLSVKRPLAKHFVAMLATAQPKVHWSRVLTVSELASGDLIAWDKPADVISSNTGHVMLVAAKPRFERAGRWAIPIIDSSASAHGARDARHASHATGIGRATIVLETSAGGEPIAYHWSTAKTSLRHDTRLVLGRIH